MSILTHKVIMALEIKNGTLCNTEGLFDTNLRFPSPPYKQRVVEYFPG